MVFGHLSLLESRGQAIPGVLKTLIACSKNTMVFSGGQATQKVNFYRGKVGKVEEIHGKTVSSRAKVMGGLMAVIPASEVDTDG